MLEFIFTENSFKLDPLCRPHNSEEEKWQEEFAVDRYQALFRLGFQEKMACSPSFLFLFQLAGQYLKILTALSELEVAREKIEVKLPEESAQSLLNAVPFGIGTEFINREWLTGIFDQLTAVFSAEISSYAGSVSLYLTEKSQHLRVPERIFFHLVESKNEEYPFAFLATYATKNESGAVQHMPLQYALTEYKDNREKLLQLLSCLNQAAEVSPLLAGFMENGEMFHPLQLTSREAYELLKAIPAFEAAGIMCRVPNWWKRKACAVNMSVSLGGKKPTFLGLDTVIEMQPSLVVDGVPLSERDIAALLAQTDGLAYLKGRWVEVNHSMLQKLMSELEVNQGEISLREALQLGLKSYPVKQVVDVGPVITNGAWLGELLQNMRSPTTIRKNREVPQTFKTQLRPYQATGYNWLNYMAELGFGACLADDMGLGKTVQVLAFLDRLRKKDKNARVLLIVPASLLGNWQKEIARFAPRISVQVLHGRTAPALAKEFSEEPQFLTLTTYGMAVRIKNLEEQKWTCIILDEAQAIKNPSTKQTRTIKGLQSDVRIAMTGTPIENDLTNLWSLFDFLNKGLLGTSKEFHDFSKQLAENPEGYNRLKTMVAPFILRRLKSDPKVISDLPEKLEQVDYVQLSKKQVVLYRRQVAEVAEKLEDSSGLQRRGIVLAAITKLKQICNHPDQYLGQESFLPEESGKFQLLREICETIYEKRERVLVFTQYREIADDLAAFLERIFGCKGFVLHGGTRIPDRIRMVDEFNSENYNPFMVLSVKAGGTGLNLTAANHVIHFDRWWNPAVENQATDRAFRIGQQKNVFVHKLVTVGTIEEKIDAMINSKKELAENIIGGSNDKWLTELGNEELLSIMSLD